LATPASPQSNVFHGFSSNPQARKKKEKKATGQNRAAGCTAGRAALLFKTPLTGFLNRYTSGVFRAGK
jgi:hypothetical protein